MKIWYDACTGKHVRYGVAIAGSLRQHGHDVLLTTREHPDTLELAKALNEKFIPVGKYRPATLFSRLDESARRIIKLSKLLRNSIPDVAISHQSVELCRVAFGLNIPIILTADTPHATAVNRLTMPFASSLVVSEAIPKTLFRSYGRPRIFQFRGVDEVAWARNSESLKNLGFKKPLIVVRQIETRASYAFREVDITQRIAKKLATLGNVLFIPRYNKIKKEGLIVAEKFMDSASLVTNADLVVSAGGTISREAALQGVPSIVVSELGRTYVNKYLSDKGFPLFIIKAPKALALAKRYLGRKWDVKEKLAALENPVDVITKIIAEKDFSTCSSTKARTKR